MPEQHRQLYVAFLDWKGEIEQTGDVCVMGLRIP